jgi:hypothetical protein
LIVAEHTDITHVVHCCRIAAAGIYDKKAPSIDYADNVARLLFGTAAVESNFQYRRQIGFKYPSLRGAFGLWQTESASAEDSIKMIKNRRWILQSCIRILPVDSAEVLIKGVSDTGVVLRALEDQTHDILGAVLCRLHYMRVAYPVPRSVDAQAGYWKAHYNTFLGKGTPDKYMATLARYGAYWAL